MTIPRPIDRETRNIHVTNLKQHVLSGAELETTTVSDMEGFPEAFSGVIHTLGYKMMMLARGMPVGEEVAPGFMERYSGIINAGIEHIPNDAADTPRLLDMKESLGV